MQTDRTRILALARTYDLEKHKGARRLGMLALMEAIEADSDFADMYSVPSGGMEVEDHRTAVRLWVAASRRAAKNPASRLGRPTTNRPHRLDVPATAATRARIEAHAGLTGKSRATVAGDFLEVGAIAATNPPKGDGGRDE